MKKYRCPVCGEECITLRKKIFTYSLPSRGRDYNGNICPKCGGMFMPYPKRGIKFYIEAVIISLLISSGFLLTIFVSSAFVLLMVSSFFFIPLLIMPLFSIDYPLVKYKRVDLMYERPALGRRAFSDHRGFIIPEPNARIRLKQKTGKIGHLDIYGIRFEQKTKAVRFREEFADGLVPVVFHTESEKRKSEAKPKEKLNDGESEVTLMNMKFIPEELLYFGSEFTVIDNGKEIASGLIMSVYEPAESDE